MTVTYVEGMKLFLYVWDAGQLEGYAVYVNDTLVVDSTEVAKKYPIDPLDPGESWGLIVQFAGVDGGATKLVDERHSPPQIVAHQGSGVSHAYTITRPA